MLINLDVILGAVLHMIHQCVLNQEAGWYNAIMEHKIVFFC